MHAWHITCWIPYASLPMRARVDTADSMTDFRAPAEQTNRLSVTLTPPTRITHMHADFCTDGASDQGDHGDHGHGVEPD